MMTTDTEMLSDLPIHPGETLADGIEEHALTRAQLATLMGRPPQEIDEIVRGSIDITDDIATDLERVFGVSARFWIGLQARYDDAVAFASSA